MQLLLTGRAEEKVCQKNGNTIGRIYCQPAADIGTGFGSNTTHQQAVENARPSTVSVAVHIADGKNVCSPNATGPGWRGGRHKD